ncbi:MAG: septal ring lytic transglycosylase RlpA family protein [Pseudomonadota bacterium]
MRFEWDGLNARVAPCASRGAVLIGLASLATLGGCASFAQDRYVGPALVDEGASPKSVTGDYISRSWDRSYPRRDFRNTDRDGSWGGAWRDPRRYRGFDLNENRRYRDRSDRYPRDEFGIAEKPRFPIQPIYPRRLRLRVGRPYEMFGRYWVPRHEPDYDETGIGVWYGAKWHGMRTASGEPFNMYGFSAAHPTLAFNSMVRVTNLRNRRSVIVRINDRGPFNKGRLIDVSRAAARRLGFINAGRARVRVRYIGEARDYPRLVRRGYPNESRAPLVTRRPIRPRQRFDDDFDREPFRSRTFDDDGFRDRQFDIERDPFDRDTFSGGFNDRTAPRGDTVIGQPRYFSGAVARDAKAGRDSELSKRLPEFLTKSMVPPVTPASPDAAETFTMPARPGQAKADAR